MLTSRLRSSQTPRLVVLALVAGALGAASRAGAQEFQDLKKPATPLVLQSQGSFTVGGDIVFSDALGSGGSGHIAVNQMYVQYKVPPSSRVPVVMVHGADLSGKSYETTPDGRMGWDEYFVRKGHAVYLPLFGGERIGHRQRRADARMPVPRDRVDLTIVAIDRLPGRFPGVGIGEIPDARPVGGKTHRQQLHIAGAGHVRLSGQGDEIEVVVHCLRRGCQ